MLMWLLPEVCYISLPGKVCNSFIGSIGTGSRTGNILFTERYSLKSVCVWSGAGEHSRLHSSRSIRAGHRGEGGTGTGGTLNIERACYFWYLLYVVYFYTHWKNKVRWDCRKISLAWPSQHYWGVPTSYSPLIKRRVMGVYNSSPSSILKVASKRPLLQL